MINARSETAPEKPAFRNAFKRRRCLIPVSEFYEWQKHGLRKQPFYVRMKNRRLFAIAGLWERWEGDKPLDGVPVEDGRTPIESSTLLTAEANEVVSPLHDRMPVIVAPPLSS
jgi:putative SOS response-associated peptidase YedK